MTDPKIRIKRDGSMEAIGRSESWEAVPRDAQLEIERLSEALQGVIDWADLALSNPQAFDSHGVKNLDGPAFDKARTALSLYSLD